MSKFFCAIAAIGAAAFQTSAADWQLIWSDEFDRPGLPDPAKWDYEVGFVRNHEAQYYTQGRLENARVEDGMLVIECRKEHYKPENHEPVDYTSASLNTLGTASWCYGRLEMRAKLPHGAGVWPAFWTLGTNITQVGWPACGEDDIMELVGKEPHNIYGTAHFGTNHVHQSDGGKTVVETPSDEFHIYAVEWYPDRIDFFVDNQKYHTFSTAKAGAGEDNPFHKPHYILINFALGGSWGGPIDDSVLPQKYVIDYVRVYQEKKPSGKD